MEIPDDDRLAMRDKAISSFSIRRGCAGGAHEPRAGRINFSDATVRVTGKGAKTRIVPVGSQALAALKAWLGERALLVKAGTERCS